MEVVIVVKQGRVEAVYADDPSVIVDVVDFDFLGDEERYNELRKELAEAQAHLHEVY